jgi:Family of unknown function (DUF6283)
MTLMRPRKVPCSSCPYRIGVPSGIWAASEYAKLAPYDLDTGGQAQAGAFELFACHQADGHLCAGWTGCHDMNHNLAIRLHHAEVDIPAVPDYSCPVPLFSSGAEAAAHGLRDIGRPSAEARALIGKLMRLRVLRGRPVRFR